MGILKKSKKRKKNDKKFLKRGKKERKEEKLKKMMQKDLHLFRLGAAGAFQMKIGDLQLTIGEQKNVESG